MSTINKLMAYVDQQQWNELYPLLCQIYRSPILATAPIPIPNTNYATDIDTDSFDRRTSELAQLLTATSSIVRHVLIPFLRAPTSPLAPPATPSTSAASFNSSSLVSTILPSNTVTVQDILKLLTHAVPRVLQSLPHTCHCTPSSSSTPHTSCWRASISYPPLPAPLFDKFGPQPPSTATAYSNPCLSRSSTQPNSLPLILSSVEHVHLILLFLTQTSDLLIGAAQRMHNDAEECQRNFFALAQYAYAAGLILTKHLVPFLAALATSSNQSGGSGISRNSSSNSILTLDETSSSDPQPSSKSVAQYHTCFQNFRSLLLVRYDRLELLISLHGSSCKLVGSFLDDYYRTSIRELLVAHVPEKAATKLGTAPTRALSPEFILSSIQFLFENNSLRAFISNVVRFTPSADRRLWSQQQEDGQKIVKTFKLILDVCQKEISKILDHFRIETLHHRKLSTVTTPTNSAPSTPTLAPSPSSGSTVTFPTASPITDADAPNWLFDIFTFVCGVLSHFGHEFDAELLVCAQAIALSLPQIHTLQPEVRRIIATLQARAQSCTAKATETQHASLSAWQECDSFERVMSDTSFVLRLQERYVRPNQSNDTKPLNLETQPIIPSVLQAPYETTATVLTAATADGSAQAIVPYNASFRKYEFSLNAQQRLNAHRSATAAGHVAPTPRRNSLSPEALLSANATSSPTSSASSTTVHLSPASISHDMHLYTRMMFHLLREIFADSFRALGGAPPSNSDSFVTKAKSLSSASDGAAKVDEKKKETDSKKDKKDKDKSKDKDKDKESPAEPIPTPERNRGFQVVALGPFARGEASPSGSTNLICAVLLQDEFMLLPRESTVVKEVAADSKSTKTKRLSFSKSSSATPTTQPPAEPTPFTPSSFLNFFLALFETVALRLRCLSVLGYPTPDLDSHLLRTLRECIQPPSSDPSLNQSRANALSLLFQSPRGMSTAVITSLKLLASAPAPAQAVDLMMNQQHVWSWNDTSNSSVQSGSSVGPSSISLSLSAAPLQAPPTSSHVLSEHLLGEFNRFVWKEYLLSEKMAEGEKFANLYLTTATTATASSVNASSTPAISPSPTAASSDPTQSPPVMWYTDLNDELNDIEASGEHATNTATSHSADGDDENGEHSASEVAASVERDIDPALSNLSTQRFSLASGHSFSNNANNATHHYSPQQLLFDAAKSHGGKLHPLVQVRLQRVALFLLKQHFPSINHVRQAGIDPTISTLSSISPSLSRALTQLLAQSDESHAHRDLCVDLQSDVLQPLLLWLADVSLFYSSVHPSSFHNLRSLSTNRRLHSRFHDQLQEALTMLLAARNAGLDRVPVFDRDHTTIKNPTTNSTAPVTQDSAECNFAEDSCHSNVSAAESMSNVSPFAFPSPASTLMPHCECACTCNKHQFMCCTHLNLQPLLTGANVERGLCGACSRSSPPFHAIHTLTWQLLIPLHHAATIWATEAKGWGMPVNSTSSGSNSSSTSRTALQESESIRDNYDPLLSSLSDWVKIRRAFQTAQAQALAMHRIHGIMPSPDAMDGDDPSKESEDPTARRPSISPLLLAPPFQEEIEVLQERIDALLQQLAHDQTRALLTSVASVASLAGHSSMARSRDASVIREKGRRVMKQYIAYFHRLIQDLPTRYHFVRLLQAHVYHYSFHRPEVLQSLEPASAIVLKNLFSFMALWPMHAGGRIVSVTEQLRAKEILQRFIWCETNDALLARGSAEVCFQHTWNVLDELMCSIPNSQPALAPRPLIKPVSDALIKAHANHATPYAAISSVSSCRSVWLVPGSISDVPTDTSSTLSTTHRVLLQHVSSVMLSELLYGVAVRCFVATLNWDTLQKPEHAIWMLPPTDSMLLADMLNEENVHLRGSISLPNAPEAPNIRENKNPSVTETITHNMKLLELSLDARSFTMKFIETLLFCPRQEGPNELLAVPVPSSNSNGSSSLNSTSNEDGKHSKERHSSSFPNGFPSANWQRGAKYCLIQSPVSFPFHSDSFQRFQKNINSPEAAEEALSAASGVALSEEDGLDASNGGVQTVFAFENAVETRRVRSELQERVNVRSLLFCMDRIKDPLDATAINHLLNMDFKQVLQQWLQNLVKINAQVSGINPAASPKLAGEASGNASSTGSPARSGFTLPPLTIPHLIARWEHIQSVLRHVRTVTTPSIESSSESNGKRMMLHWELMEQIDPGLFALYNSYAWNNTMKEVADTQPEEGDEDIMHAVHETEDEANESEAEAAARCLSPFSSLGSFSGKALQRYEALPKEWVPAKLGYLHQSDAPSHMVSKRPFYSILPRACALTNSSREMCPAPSVSLQDLLENTLPTVSSLYSNLRTIVHRLRTRSSIFSPSRFQPHLYELLLNSTEWRQTVLWNQAGEETTLVQHIRIGMPSRAKRREKLHYQASMARNRLKSIGEADSNAESGGDKDEYTSFPEPSSFSTTAAFSTFTPSASFMSATATRYSAQESLMGTTNGSSSSRFPKRHLDVDDIETESRRKISITSPIASSAAVDNLQQTLWTATSLSELLRSSPLQHAHLPSCELLTDALLEALINTSGGVLLSLDISECNGLTSPNSALSSLSLKCRNVSWLNVSGLNSLEAIGPSSLQTFFFSKIPEFPALELLYANQCVNLKTIKLVAPQLKGLFARDCVRLESLNTGETNKLSSSAPIAAPSILTVMPHQAQTIVAQVAAAVLPPAPTLVALQLDLRGCNSLEKSPVELVHEDYFEAHVMLHRLNQQHLSAYAPNALSSKSSTHIVMDAYTLPTTSYCAFDGLSSAKIWGGWWIRELDLSTWNPSVSPVINAKKLAQLQHVIVHPTMRVISLLLNYSPALTSIVIDSSCLESLALRDCCSLKQIHIFNGVQCSLKEIDLTSAHGFIDALSNIHNLLRSTPLLKRLILDDNVRLLEEQWQELQAKYETRNEWILRTYDDGSPNPQENMEQILASNDETKPRTMQETLLKYGPQVTFFTFLHSPVRGLAHRLQMGAVDSIRLEHHHESCLSVNHPRTHIRPSYRSTGGIHSPLSPSWTAEEVSPHSGGSHHSSVSPPVNPFQQQRHQSSNEPCVDEFTVFDKDDNMLLALSASLQNWGWLNTSLHSLTLICSHADPANPNSATSMLSSITTTVGLPALCNAILCIPALTYLHLEGQCLGNKATAALLAALGGYEGLINGKIAQAAPTGAATLVRKARLNSLGLSSRDSSVNSSVSQSRKSSRANATRKLSYGEIYPSLDSFAFVSTPGARHLPQLETLILRHQALTEEFTVLDGPMHCFFESFATSASSSLTCLDLSHNYLRGAGLKSLGQVIRTVCTAAFQQLQASASSAGSSSASGLSLLELSVEKNGFDIADVVHFTHEIDASQPLALARVEAEQSLNTLNTGELNGVSGNSSADKKKSRRKSSGTKNIRLSTRSPLSRLSLGCTSLVQSLVKRLLPLHVESWSATMEHSKEKLARVTAVRDQDLKALESSNDFWKRDKDRDAAMRAKSKEQITQEKALVMKQSEEIQYWHDRCHSFVHYGIVSSTTPALQSNDANTFAADGNSAYSYGFNASNAAVAAANQSYGYGGYGALPPADDALSAASASASSSATHDVTLMLDSFPIPTHLVELDAEGSLTTSGRVTFERGLLHRISEAFYLHFLKNTENRIDEERHAAAAADMHAMHGKQVQSAVVTTGVPVTPTTPPIRAASSYVSNSAMMESTTPVSPITASRGEALQSPNHRASVSGGAVEIDYSASSAPYVLDPSLVSLREEELSEEDERRLAEFITHDE